jgi:acetoacetyl-CoA synthetase
VDIAGPVPDHPLWTPSPERAGATRLAGFRAAAARSGVEAAAYADLHAWSVADAEAFWALVWEECGVVGERGDRVIERGGTMAQTRFFPDARLSVVENLLRGEASATAVVAIDETGRRTACTRGELRDQAAAVAGALVALGVSPGDRVAAWLPNGVEALVVMLGAASIGAVFSSCSPDFGAPGVIDRFGQIEPVVLVAADGYHYGGKRHDCLERLATIRAALPSLRATVVVPVTGAPLPADVVPWSAFVAAGAGSPVEPARFGFDHPWYVLYSSGTTGVPKCIVHRTGGVLVQHLKEQQLHCDIRPGDRVLYYTTTGWMMWNWLASVLASEATILCFDGSPFHAEPTVLFDLVDREGLTLLGVSAKFIDSLRKADVRPAASHDLSTLRTVCSTGSALSVDGFAHVYAAVKHDVHLASMSGGTDLCACFVGGDPTAPVYAGELQRPALGMAVDVWDDHGGSLSGRPGEAGELVCTAPFPSMPLGFWGDGSPGLPDPSAPGPRYRAAYFERFPDVWAQGDFASWTGHGGIVIHGRSDATLNPGGVRIGTAEIYRVVEQLPEVTESLVFAQDWHDDVRIVLLVRLAEGHELDERLAAEVRRRIRAATSPRHVPAVIAQVGDLPRTRSNKLVELAVADAVNGRPVRNTESIANPEAIQAIVALDALRT